MVAFAQVLNEGSHVTARKHGTFVGSPFVGKYLVAEGTSPGSRRWNTDETRNRRGSDVTMVVQLVMAGTYESN